MMALAKRSRPGSRVLREGDRAAAQGLRVLESWWSCLTPGQRRYLGKRRFATGARRSPPLIPVSLAWRMGATLYCWGVVILSLVPFFAVIVLATSLSRPGATSPVASAHLQAAAAAATPSASATTDGLIWD